MNIVEAKFALVIGEPAKNQYKEYDKAKWGEFLAKIREHGERISETQKIYENVWLLYLDTDMPLLCTLFEWSKSYSIPLNILFLDGPPDWIRYPKPPED